MKDNFFIKIIILSLILILNGCKYISVKKIDRKVANNDNIKSPLVSIIGPSIVKDNIKLLIYGKPNCNILINNHFISKLNINGKSIINYKISDVKDGKNELNISLEDNKNFISEPTKITFIKDTKPPTIKLIGPKHIYIQKNSKFNDPYIDVKDNISPTHKIIIKKSGYVDTSRVGEYKLEYIAIDEAKNLSRTNRVVEVLNYKKINTASFIVTDDDVTISPNTTIDIDVVSNDIVEPGNNLKVNSIIKYAMHGNTKIENNKIIYTPFKNYLGDDEIEYSVVDLHGVKKSGKVYIHIVDNKIDYLFNRYIDELTIDLKNRLQKGDMYALYDMQTYLQSSVIYADRFHKKEMLKRLLKLVSIPFEPKYIGDDELWLDYTTLKNYKNHDPYLATLQYFSLLTRVLSACERNGVSTQSFKEPKIFNNHIYNNLKIIQDHFKKWSKVLDKRFNIDKKLKIKVRFHNKNDRLFVKIMTKKGWRYLYYNLENKSRGRYNKHYIHIALGDRVRLDNWYQFDRNLQKDLSKFEKDNEFLYAYEIQIQTKDSVDISSLDVDGFLYPSKKVKYNFPINEGFKRLWKSQSGNTDIFNDYIKLKSYSNDTVEFKFDFENAYLLWDAPREISDTDIFLYQSLLQFDDYCRSIGVDFDLPYKDKLIKGLYKNIVNNFDYNSNFGTYSFATYKRVESANNSYSYSGYGDETSKKEMFDKLGKVKLPPKSAITSWDVSHGRRINWLFETSLMFGDFYNVVIPENIIDGYIDGLSKNVCIGDINNPHFSIYLNGRNGWYRVGYLGRLFFGYSPKTHDMDIHFASGSFAIFSSKNIKIKNWIDNWVNRHYLLMKYYQLLDYYVSKDIDIF